MTTKNYGVSNKAKLLNITRQTEGQTYMQVLLRFIQERFLYRLSVSEYRGHFFLKGGALLYAHERFNARPTMDMDFMGDRIDRAESNSRMKDFFDVYTILRSGKVDMAVLEEAVREVFANRGTEYMEAHPLFAEEFVASGQRQTMWRAFLRKMKYPVALEFGEVMEVITSELKPMWERMER